MLEKRSPERAQSVFSLRPWGFPAYEPGEHGLSRTLGARQTQVRGELGCLQSWAPGAPTGRMWLPWVERGWAEAQGTADSTQRGLGMETANVGG